MYVSKSEELKQPYNLGKSNSNINKPLSLNG